MAPVKAAHAPLLARRAWLLAGIQAAQLALGVLGQLLLLVRRSPHVQTDIFLMVSGVPWLVSAAALLAGVETALPASLHRVQAAEGEAGRRRFLAQVMAGGAGVALTAAFVSGGIVAVWAGKSGLASPSNLWLGLILGGQLLPFLGASVARGWRVAQDRPVRAQLSLLAASGATVLGYGLFPGEPAFALSLALLLAAVAGLAAVWPWREAATWRAPRFTNLHPELRRLIANLAALSIAVGMVHAEALLLRSAVFGMSVGAVAALATAQRVWDAALAVIVAACVTPIFPRWVRGGDVACGSLRWSWGRTLALTLLAGALIGPAAWGARAWVLAFRDWPVGAQALYWVLALLPRFLLLSALQPLVLRQYARGRAWIPVAGSLLGLLVLAFGVWVLGPRWGMRGLALVAALATLPGWLILAPEALREVRVCAS